MPKLYFHYGAMNSGKTIDLLRAAHNYEERGMNVILAKPHKDTKGEGKVTSRVGMERSVDLLISSDLNIQDEIIRLNKQKRIDCLLVDEAQFLDSVQVDQLFNITLDPGIPVMAYGLRTDFKTYGFPGSTRLLEIAHVIKEVRTVCQCGANATLNARSINGNFISKGEQVVIDGAENVEYQSFCAKCYTKKVGAVSSL